MAALLVHDLHMSQPTELHELVTAICEALRQAHAPRLDTPGPQAGEPASARRDLDRG
jgi:hypothetical protein